MIKSVGMTEMTSMMVILTVWMVVLMIKSVGMVVMISMMVTIMVGMNSMMDMTRMNAW